MNQIIEIKEANYNNFDILAPHILQSKIWADFKKSIGSETIFLGEKENDGINKIWSMYISYIPRLKLKFGVMSQCLKPTKDLIEKLKQISERENLVYIKIEPLIQDNEENRKEMEAMGLIKGRDWFLKNTFVLDLKKLSIDDLFNNFSSSTRRNVRIAQKKGVFIQKNEFKEKDYANLDAFLKIQDTTTKRKNFSAHDKKYFYNLYDTLKQNLVIFHAIYNNETIAGAIFFKFNNTYYYYAGASIHKYIDTKATNLLLYEAIKDAYENKYEYFNFWGALTNNPSPKDPLYGTHNFKKGFGGNLIEYIGAYDLVNKSILYSITSLAYASYWNIIKLKRKLKI